MGCQASSNADDENQINLAALADAQAAIRKTDAYIVKDLYKDEIKAAQNFKPEKFTKQLCEEMNSEFEFMEKVKRLSFHTDPPTSSNPRLSLPVVFHPGMDGPRSSREVQLSAVRERQSRVSTDATSFSETDGKTERSRFSLLLLASSAK